jgi:hypothetical protein
MFQQHERNAHPRCKRSGTLCPYAAELAGRRVLGELRHEQSDSELPGGNEVGDPRIGRLLLGARRPDTCKQSGQNERNPKFTDHEISPKRPPQVTAGEFITSDLSYDSVNSRGKCAGSRSDLAAQRVPRCRR